MKTLSKMALGIAFFVLSGLLFIPAGSAAKAPGEKCYTKVNIWYEFPDKIFTTNYHKGEMVPVGSQVEILKRKKNEIQFKDIRTGIKCKLIRIPKFMDVAGDELFERYFSTGPVLDGADYAKFSPMEKENIKAGTLAVGMSKDAVLMAYGYPPTHRTKSLADSTWTYWKSKFVNFEIQFDDKGLVAFIQK
ncbi:MAG: hypothetical protein V1882_05740 [Candidatus Omnitrophota bacterium]